MNQIPEPISPNNVNQQKPSYLEYDSFIQRLRNEGNDLKDCFTKFTFQAILFTAAALGLIGTLGLLGYNSDNANISEGKVLNATIATVLICIPVTQILQTVIRIGLYKYGSSNRHFGYQLYLERKGLSQLTWDDLNWETRMIAWRILQSTIFIHAYEFSTCRWINWIYPRVEKVHSELKVGKYWWRIKSFKHGLSDYHAGSYLRRMSIVLTILTFFSFIVMAFTIFNAWCFAYSTTLLIVTGIAAFWFVYLCRNTVGNNRRREIIESEMLSIHGCCEVWRIIDRVLSMRNPEDENLLTHINKHASQFNIDNILQDWSKYFDLLDSDGNLISANSKPSDSSNEGAASA